MVKKKIVKIGKIYYARVYSNSGMLLDSLGFSNKQKALKSLSKVKASWFK